MHHRREFLKKLATAGAFALFAGMASTARSAESGKASKEVVHYRLVWRPANNFLKAVESESQFFRAKAADKPSKIVKLFAGRILVSRPANNFTLHDDFP